jgi:hypothetical protein
MNDSFVPGERVATDPLLVMRRVVNEALVLIPSADGAVVELVSDELLTYVCAAGSLASSVGTQVRADSSLSGLAVRAAAPLRCDDSEVDERVDRAACRRVGAASASRLSGSASEAFPAPTNARPLVRRGTARCSR